MAATIRGSLSHWLRGLPPPEQRPVWSGARQSHNATDVTIVGGGITGCALALHLRTLDPELKVTIIEARGISEGATGRNGGLMWPSLNSPWLTTVEQFGLPTAKALVEFERHCWQDIHKFVRDGGLEDSLQFGVFPDGAYMLCATPDELAAEVADHEAQVKAGVQPFMTPVSVKHLTERLGVCGKLVGGMHQEQVAGVTAVRLAHTLLRKAAAVAPSQNLTILEHSRVERVEKLQDGRFRAHVIPTDEGTLDGPPMADAPRSPLTLDAPCLVHCTNGYNDLLPALADRGWLTAVRNQVAVTKPLPADHPMPRAAFYADTGYIYFSRRHDDRVVVGGFRHTTPHMELGTRDDSSEGLDAHVSRQLRLYLPSAFPSLFTAPGSAERSVSTAGGSGAGAGGTRDAPSRAAQPCPVEYELEWSGILGFTKDRWPLVGKVPDELAAAPGPEPDAGLCRGEYCCMGFSGHGMTRAYTCARNLAHMLLGRPVEAAFPEHVMCPARVLHPGVGRAADAPSLPKAAAATSASVATSRM